MCDAMRCVLVAYIYSIVRCAYKRCLLLIISIAHLCVCACIFLYDVALAHVLLQYIYLHYFINTYRREICRRHNVCIHTYNEHTKYLSICQPHARSMYQIWRRNEYRATIYNTQIHAHTLIRRVQ